MLNIKTKLINNLYFVTTVNHIDHINGIPEHILWDVGYASSYSFTLLRGKLISMRNSQEPDPKCTTILNMSEYILNLVQ